MPLITSHMNTPCIHANQNAHEAVWKQLQGVRAMSDQNASTGPEIACQTYMDGEAYWKERALNAERQLLRFSERLTNPAVCITHIDDHSIAVSDGKL